ncbi:hypothetical protein [Pedobacter gandavensis]|uniref:hypothetical protein n=1 Tax=Pedobacter gandavensis TaxID=2679963 RepID=UPI002930B2E9|nr:hypothetical protein [Pedobacter gandavensis]
MEKILKALNYQPVEISDDDLNNPVPSMAYFFVNHPLHESRTKLWKLYEGWIHFAAESPDGEELTDMLFFYNQLIELMNLCYVFTQNTYEDK